MKMNEPVGKAETIEFKLNGDTISAFAGETIIQAAKRHGVDIPHLCYKEGYRPDGNCRACMVEIKGERVLAPSCCRQPAKGMEVASNSERAVHSQKMVVELLMSDVPKDDLKPGGNELFQWAGELGVTRSRFAPRAQPAPDFSHPAMSVNLDACIQCTRCVRACREEQVNDVIGYAFRGLDSKIVFDFDDPMGESTCVACGECVQACPTGALAPAKNAYKVVADKTVDSVCPYCGVGCQLTYHVKDNAIVRVDGRDGPSNHERLCVKGRFGFDYVQHPQRLMKPLIRKPGIRKTEDFSVDPTRWSDVFREATWEEALDLAASGLKKIRDASGPNALAGFGSAKGSNEEAYLFQKLVRTGFGTNNVDHCTRLCHASSVVALLEGIGSGAVSNQVSDVAQSEVILVIGANPTSNHPVAATWMKNAVERGAKMIVADPRRNDLARHAWRFLQFTADTDVALLNAMIYTIIEEGLVDAEFVRQRTTGFEALKENAKGFSPELMAPICGIPAETIREVARAYATSKASIILWGMGISQHVHGTDNARCLIALTLMTGQIGRPGTGLHPLRGQNNVQGASDAGLIPMMYPDYQRVDNPEANARFEKFWGAQARPQSRPHGGRDHGCRLRRQDPRHVHHGREPRDVGPQRAPRARRPREAGHAWSCRTSSSPRPRTSPTSCCRPPRGRRRPAPSPTPTAWCSSGGARSTCRAMRARTCGSSSELANRLGCGWNYQGPESGVAEVYEEMRQAMNSIGGISWERLEEQSSVTYPCRTEDDPGQSVVFTENFPTKDGRGKFVPADLIPANERPDAEYPFVLITGRQLEHWHTGSMTRRASVLDAIEPRAVCSLHPLDLDALGAKAGDVITVASRRGEIALTARADDGTPRGTVFIPFAFYEAAANLLTNAALDPFGKIAEVKYCAVKLRKGGKLTPLGSYGGGQSYKIPRRRRP